MHVVRRHAVCFAAFDGTGIMGDCVRSRIVVPVWSFDEREIVL
jgi:hypothetical protein